jgi:hypothetical protein
MCNRSNHFKIDNSMPLFAIVTDHYIKQSIERIQSMSKLTTLRDVGSKESTSFLFTAT